MKASDIGKAALLPFVIVMVGTYWLVRMIIALPIMAVAGFNRTCERCGKRTFNFEVSCQHCGAHHVESWWRMS